MILCMGLLELVSVGSVFPFLGILSQPEMLTENRWLARAYLGTVRRHQTR